jgi:hypothetical protein
VTDREANELLWSGLPSVDGWYAMRLGAWEGGRLELPCRVTDRRRFLRWCTFHGWSSELTFGVRPYLERRSRRLYADSGAMWARVETNAQVRALEAFNPEPSLVLREGASVKHWAFWFVRQALDPDDGVKVNKHLAHKLGTKKLHAEQAFIPPAGAVLREGRARPCPVVVAGGSGELLNVGRVCATLPHEIPDPQAWKNKTAA